MRAHRMKETNKKITVLGIISLTLMALLSPIAVVRAQYSDSESPLIITGLDQKSMVWTVTDSMGIFAQDGYHPDDRIRYEVYSADAVNRRYIVNASESSWILYPATNWEVDESVTVSDYKLIKRDWYSAARNIYSVQDSEYWLTTSELRSTYTIDYSDVFIGGQLINIVTIAIKINETNYDIAKYTRAEGILLERHTVVDTTDNQGDPLFGEFKIELTDFSGNFDVSFWHYVIWFAIIFVSVLVLVVILSVVISKRRQTVPDY